MWNSTNEWRPCRPGSSGGVPVKDTESGKLGLAKPQLAHREKLAGDLAELAGVNVPKVVLAPINGGTAVHGISIAHSKEGFDVKWFREQKPEVLDTPEMKDAFKRGSGLLAFHAWLSTGDLKDDHLAVAIDSTGAYTVAGVDFADSIQWQQSDGGNVQASTGLQTLTANVDKNVIAATVDKIESVTDDQIKTVVNALPDNLPPNADKERIISGLIARRGKVRKAMKDQGWLE